MKRLCTLVLGAAALAAAVQGCSNEPALYLGGPPGPATGHKLSSSRVTVVIGDSAAVGAQGQDAVGNATADAVTLTTCDAAVVTVTGASSSAEWTTTAFLKGVGMGNSCVLAQSGGLTDTIKVTVGPAGVSIVGDTVGSGHTTDLTVVAVDRDGNELTGTVTYTWSSSNVNRAWLNPVTGTAFGRDTGAVNIMVLAPGGANAMKTGFRVNPGAFTGVLSATSGDGGNIVKIARAADGQLFNSATQVRVGSGTALFTAYIDSWAPDTIVAAVPVTGAAGAQTLWALQGPVGAAWLAKQVTPFTVNKQYEDAYAPGNTNAAGTPPAGAPEVSTIMTANRNVYFAHAGFGTGAAARGFLSAGTQVDHYFMVTTGATARAVTMTASWSNTSNVDLYVLDGAGTVLASGRSTSTSGETLTYTFPANTTTYVAASMVSAQTNVTNLRITFAGL